MSDNVIDIGSHQKEEETEKVTPNMAEIEKLVQMRLSLVQNYKDLKKFSEDDILRQFMRPTLATVSNVMGPDGNPIVQSEQFSVEEALEKVENMLKENENAIRKCMFSMP